MPLVVLSSHLAAQRQGVAGSSLAAAEGLVALWAPAIPPALCRCGVCLLRLIRKPPDRLQPARLRRPSCANGWLRRSLISFWVLLPLSQANSFSLRSQWCCRGSRCRSGWRVLRSLWLATTTRWCVRRWRVCGHEFAAFLWVLYASMPIKFLRFPWLRFSLSRCSGLDNAAKPSFCARAMRL